MTDSTTTCTHYVGCPHDVDEGTFDRCPTCCVAFSEPVANDNCPVPEQHAPKDVRVWLVEWETTGGQTRGQCGTAAWAKRASDELIANATIVAVGAWPADEPPTACIDCGNEFGAPVAGDVLLEAAGVTTYAKGACGRCLPCTQGRRWNAEDAPLAN